MPVPAIVAGAAAVAGRLAAKKATKEVTKKVATAAAKKAAASGSGKLKYKNTVKEARIDTKKLSTDRIAGKKLTKSEATARARKTPNLPREIAKEEKIRTGVNTAKPTTPKVAVKKGKK
jgi:hypothetical protein